jgi:hypothetical protein
MYEPHLKHITYLCANMTHLTEHELPLVIARWRHWKGTPSDLIYLAGYLHGQGIIMQPFVQYEQYITLGALSNLALYVDPTGLTLRVIDRDEPCDTVVAKTVELEISDFINQYRDRSVTWGNYGEELSWWTRAVRHSLESIKNSSSSNKEE